MTLYTYFIGYESSDLIVDNGTSGQLTLVIDPALSPSPTQFTQSLQRKVIPNYTDTAVPAASDARWVEELTLDLTVELYDCL